MPWIRRQRYDPYHDPYYGRPAYRQSSCLRDACLLETGCCIAEWFSGNYLALLLSQMPRLLSTAAAEAGTSGRPGRSARFLLSGIRHYQRQVSAHRPACCRFTPSCSEFAAQAIEQQGAARGGMLAIRRLIRCRPGGSRGADPVPAT